MAFENVGEVMKSVEKVEKSLNDMRVFLDKKSLSIWDKIKFWYYNFKYKLSYKLLIKNIEFSTLSTAENPRQFISFLTELVAIIASMSVFVKGDMNEFIKSKFKWFGFDYCPITIHFNIDRDKNDVQKVSKFKLVVKYKPMETAMTINKGNIVKAIIDADVDKMICNVESIYYNTDDINQANDLSVIKRHTYAIAPDGSVDDPYFIWDKKLKKDTLLNYSLLALFVISPLLEFIMRISDFKFTMKKNTVLT